MKLKKVNEMQNTKANSNEFLCISGTHENPVKISKADVRAVKASEVAAGSSVLQDLAFGLYFGMVDPELCTPEGINKAFPSDNRAVKNERSAMKLLVETPANIIKAAWDAHMAERMVKATARYTKPSLQALAKAVKDMTSTAEPKAAPVSTAKRVADILAGKGTAAQKLKAIASIPAVEKELTALLGELAEAA